MEKLGLHIIIMFFYIFQPYICPISTQIICDVILILYVGYYFISIDNFKIKINSMEKKILMGYMPFYLYICILYIARMIMDNGNSGIYLRNIFILIVVSIRVIISIWYLNILVYKKKWSEDDFSKCLIAVGVIQTICVLTAFISPSIRNFFNNLTIRYSSSKYILSALEHDIWRSYGFAKNIFDAFGYVVSLIIVIVFSYGLKKNSILILSCSALMFIMPLLNARTGLVLSAMGVFMVYIMSKKRVTISGIFKGIFMLILGGIIIYGLFQNLPENTKEWITRGMDDTSTLVTTGEKTGVYSVIMGTNFAFPENVFWGVGADREQLYGRGIESGYVNCLWCYGVVGTVLLFVGFINMFRQTIKMTNGKNEKIIIFIFEVIFFVYLIKLFSLYNTGANIMVMGLPIIYANLSYMRRYNILDTQNII